MPFDIERALREMEAGRFDPLGDGVAPPTIPASTLHAAENPAELVVSRGRVRQAGADRDGSDGLWVAQVRTLAEQSLYFFSKAILDRWWLTDDLHLPTCAWLQNFRLKRRKLLLLPREHGKTTLVCDSLPIHLVIQPAQGNVYMAGVDGSHTRIIMCCETLDMAASHIRVIESVWEDNEILRALWPHKVWQGAARRESKMWNAEAMILPRDTEFPDPTIKGIGIGAAVHGRHPNVLIKDDLVTFKAANSDADMSTAIEWHKASRNVFDGQPKHLEFIIGTRWAYHDLYQEIIDHDQSVESVTRSAIENDKIIYPIVGRRDDGQEIGFTREKLDAKKRENPVLFALNYMNDASDPELIDFPEQHMRTFRLEGGLIKFEEDDRDHNLRQLMTMTPETKVAKNPFQGLPMTPEIQRAFFDSLRRGV